MLSNQYTKALETAHTLHQDHLRKGGGVPYVSHLLSVSSLVLKAGGTEAQAIAGLLHDSLEDQGDKVSYDDLKEQFGQEVADLVLACTDETAETRKTTPWYERKRQYLAKLEDMPREACLVILCDKLDNIRDSRKESQTNLKDFWERFTEKKKGFLWFLGQMCDVLEQWKGKEFKDMPVAQLMVEEFQEIYRSIDEGHGAN